MRESAAIKESLSSLNRTDCMKLHAVVVRLGAMNLNPSHDPEYGWQDPLKDDKVRQDLKAFIQDVFQATADWRTREPSATSQRVGPAGGGAA